MLHFSVTETIESGLIDFWNKIYSTKEKFCQIIQPNDVEMALNQQLNIYDLLGSFYILIIGLIISLCMFLTEVMLSRLCSKWFDEFKMVNFKPDSTAVTVITDINSYK